MAIEWGLSNQGGFQNALALGVQFGQQIKRNQREQAAQEQATQRNNALAQYAIDPNDQNFAVVAQYDAPTAISMRSQAIQGQAQQRQQQQADMGTFRRLLKRAAASPEGWQQALGAAQNLGLDVSSIPQQYDPEWASQQLFIMDAMEQDQEGLKGIAYELQQAGYEPGTPEYEQAARQIISNKYASEYVDQQGNTRRRSMLDLQGPQAGELPQVTDDASYEALPAGAQFRDPQGNIRTKGGTASNSGGGF